MWSLIFRVAMMGGAVLVMWNVASTFLRALRHPVQTVALPPKSREEVAASEMVEHALNRIIGIEIAIAELKDHDLWAATEHFSTAVKQLTSAVLADPPRYRRARRHLGQILFGSTHVTRRFATLYQATPEPAAKVRFIALLNDLTATYERAARDYAEAGLDDLDIEVDVLRQLLERADQS